MNRKKVFGLFALLFALAAGNTTANSQDIQSVTIRPASTERILLHFRQDKSLLLRDFQGNERSLDRLYAIVSDDGIMSAVDSIIITSGASPEGIIANNLRLSEDRAEAVRSYIAWRHPDVNQRKIIKRPLLTDWEELLLIAQEDLSIPYREKLIRLIQENHKDNVAMTRKLKTLADGLTFDYIIRNHGTRLRYAAIVVYYHSAESCEMAAQSEPKPVTKSDSQSAGQHEPKLLPYDSQSVVNYARAPLLAVKTNLLFDAASIINIGVELPIGEHWSVSGEWNFPWWLLRNRQYCLQLMRATGDVRYWFGDRTGKRVLTGWFGGVYGGWGLYDFEAKDKGWQGEFFDAGIMAGYAHTIGRSGNFSLEYSLGVGYLQSDYRHYIPQLGIDDEWHLIRQHTGVERWIGPTRANVSLVWLFNHYKKTGTR